MSVKNEETLCGILPINKPENWTSFDVIAKLRGVLHIKRLGHGGTLDPMATGALPVFIGKATKCCDILPDERKEYEAGFALGLSTDTQDITGKTLSFSDSPVSIERLRSAVRNFTGDIMQTPPMYSAVKVNGRKLYELAREGKTVARRPRAAHVDEITVLKYDEQKRTGTLHIRCGRGVYVRTIINDIGEFLGAGGVMTSLCRTRSGGFTIDECFEIADAERAVKENRLCELIIPTDRVFGVYDRITLSESETRKYKNGMRLSRKEAKIAEGLYRIYGNGEFLGLAEAADGEIKVYKNF